MRALVVVVALSAVAHADPLRMPNDFAETPEAYQLAPPEELVSRLDREAVFARATMLDRAVPATGDDRARANLLFLLGELWTGYALYADAMFKETQDIDDHIAAEVALDRAKVYYRQLAKNAELRGWPNLEHALIHYAFVLRRKHEPSREPLDRLVAEFPDSRSMPYAHLALGDEAIWRREGAKAFAHYAKAAAVDFPDRAHALYKQAWSELTFNHQAEAQQLLVRALAAPGHERIAAELEKTFVVVYVKLDVPANAFDAFTRAFPERALSMLDEAATQWHRMGNYKNALAARRELLRRAPMDPKACQWEATVAILARASEDRLEFLASAERLVRRFQATRDEACESLAQDITLSNARMFAHNAQLRRTNDDLIIAERLYDLFLHGFPQHEQFASARLELIRLRARPRRTK